MRAAIYTRYGPPEVLEFMDVDMPVPKDGEVLVRIRAAGVNPLDWHFLRGVPRLARVVFGLFGPKDPRLGVDVAGHVEAVGNGVARFKPGDAVFGVCKGAFAEYTCADESRLVAKPDRVSFEQGNRSLAACRRVLTPKGIYVAIGGGDTDTSSFTLIRDSIAQMVVSWFASQTLVGFLAKHRQEDLVTLQGLLASGEITPVVDRCFPLSDLAAAIRYLEGGHACGKVVITVG